MNTRYIISMITVVIVAVAVVYFYMGAEDTNGARQPQKGAKKGEQLYSKWCTLCHGAEGKGDGEAAYLLFPKPRDFTIGSFKVRSTPSGEPPTDEDIFKTITNGLPGSAMPSFVHLSESERMDLVQYIKKLADVTEPPERVITVPPEPPGTLTSRHLGRQLYQKLKCWECHGQEGLGDGPSSLTTRDDRGYPAPPNDFTRGIYKGGSENSDIYLRFVTGMDGSPMPSYEDSINEEGRWQLVHYVRSLAGNKVTRQPSTGTINAVKISRKESVPTVPFDSRWKNVEPTTIPLMLLWQRGEVTENISVRAIHNGKDIAIMLSWADSETSNRIVRHQDYTDAVAVQFSLSSPAPNFPMGEKDKPVNIWYWAADRQLNLARFQDMEDVYPGMVGDDYLFAANYYPKSVDKPWHTPQVRGPGHDPVFITGFGADNIVSDVAPASPVEDLNAEGFGTLTAQPLEEQNVNGQGVWGGGEWRVVFTRPLKSANAFDVGFRPGRKTPIAFAVWDGSRKDRDGQKAVTTWYTLELP